MTVIWERVKTALTPLGVPVAANAYIPDSGQELPDSYLVYFMVSDPPAQHADNIEKLRTYRMQVSYFSRSGLLTMPDIVSAMTGAGFTRLPGRELPYNPDTRHFGLALDFMYLEDLYPNVITPSSLILSSSDPLDNAVDIAITKTITLTFNNALLAGETSHVVLSQADGTYKACTNSLDTTQKIMTVDPDADLDDEKLYILAIGVTDVYGDTLQTTINFTTAPWYLRGDIQALNCITAYRAKGAASLANSYINLANPGTYDLAGATPTWDTAIGWTSFVIFDLINIITLPMTFAWRGKLNDSGSVRNKIVYGGGIWNGLFGMSGGGGNFYIGMNLSNPQMFITAIADFAIQHTIIYQKLADNSQNLWIDGVLITGSPKAGTAPSNFCFGLQTADNKCESSALFNVALTTSQVAAITAAMAIL